MPDIVLKKAHKLGLAGAKSAAEKLGNKLNKDYNLVGRWTSDTYTFSRPGIEGKLMVAHEHMELEVTLGFLFKAMKAPLEKNIHKEFDAAFATPAAPAKAVTVEKAKETKAPAPKTKAATAAKKAPAAKKKGA